MFLLVMLKVLTCFSFARCTYHYTRGGWTKDEDSWNFNQNQITIYLLLANDLL